MNYKLKYHKDRARSKNYVARELEAHSLLIKYLGDLVEVKRLGIGVEKLGLVDGYSSLGNRFDFALTLNDSVLGYIEVTGDSIHDNLARFLVEKVEKAKSVGKPVWFMYNKSAKKSWRVFNASYIEKLQREGRAKVKPWIRGEKPYIHIDYSLGMTMKQFRSYITKMLPYIDEEIEW